MVLAPVLWRMLLTWLRTVETSTPNSRATSLTRLPLHKAISTRVSATVSWWVRAKASTDSGSHTWRRPKISAMAGSPCPGWPSGTTDTIAGWASSPIFSRQRRPRWAAAASALTKGRWSAARQAPIQRPRTSSGWPFSSWMRARWLMNTTWASSVSSTMP